MRKRERRNLIERDKYERLTDYNQRNVCLGCRGGSFWKGKECNRGGSGKCGRWLDGNLSNAWEREGREGGGKGSWICRIRRGRRS